MAPVGIVPHPMLRAVWVSRRLPIHRACLGDSSIPLGIEQALRRSGGAVLDPDHHPASVHPSQRRLHQITDPKHPHGEALEMAPALCRRPIG
jgi:hypothetical protein